MTFRGYIRKGVAVLDTPVPLPDGTPIRVEVERLNAEFWQNTSADELAREQGVKPIKSIAELAGDWPAEDSIDEFLAFVRGARRADALRRPGH